MNNTVKTRSKILPWAVCGLGCTFYFYEFFLQVSPSVMGKELMSDFSVTAEALGVLTGIYFYSYAAMQIPVGIMLDRFGPYKLLVVATAVCSIGSFAFGMAHTLLIVELSRFLIGFGSAFAVVGTMKLATNWFKPERFAVLTGAMITIGMMGAIFGESPLAYLVEAIGWRHSMILLSFSGIILTLLILLVVRDYPEGAEHEVMTAKTDREPLFTGLRKVLSNKQVWIIAIYGCLMYTPTPTFCGLWGVPYLMLKYDIPRTGAAAMTSIVFVGWAIGSPFWGWFSQTIGRRLTPMYIGTLGSIACLTAILYLPHLSITQMNILLLAFGIFSSGFVISFTLIKEISPRKLSATSLSYMNMMNMIGIAISQPLIGHLLDSDWQGKMLNNVRVYSLSSYTSAMTILPLVLLVALALLPFIKESFCGTRNNNSNSVPVEAN